MFGFLRHGPSKPVVRWMVWASWPIIIAAKRWSDLPLFRHIINPFFSYPWNEVTAVPIQQSIAVPENTLVPRQILERLVRELEDIFLLDACICRTMLDCRDYPKEIGCMALGPAVDRMHPSHGRRADPEEAVRHIREAANAGLVASVAHTWIDPVAFGLTRFHRLMFICFCDDCCCIYRTHMQRRGPNLNDAYKRLPGVSVLVDPETCTGCGLCVEHCFVAEMQIREGVAVPGENCKSCGRCVELCPEKAVRLEIENEESVFQALTHRIRQVADIWPEGDV